MLYFNWLFIRSEAPKIKYAFKLLFVTILIIDYKSLFNVKIKKLTQILKHKNSLKNITLICTTTCVSEPPKSTTFPRLQTGSQRHFCLCILAAKRNVTKMHLKQKKHRKMVPFEWKRFFAEKC
jgi:hypothetical protein